MIVEVIQTRRNFRKSRFSADFDYFDKLSDKEFNGYIVQGAGRSFVEVFFNEKTCKSNVKKSLNGWLADVDEDVLRGY